MTYCETADVRRALQEADLSGPIGSAFVEDAINGVSTWLRRSSGGHWYDSGGGTSIVSTSTRSVSNVRLDIPSSPHAQHDQIHRSQRGTRYPVSVDGPFARMPLPNRYFDALETLEVRQRDGSVEDWVAASDKKKGRDEDYYVQVQTEEGRGKSVLYVRADSVGARRDWDGIITASYTYGLDAQDTDWQDVRRGVALLAAAQLNDDDDVLTAIPDQGQLVNLETQSQRLVDRGMQYLEPYL